MNQKKKKEQKMNDDRLKEVLAAKQKIVEGSLTIWNERMGSLFRAGDLRGYLDAIKSPVEPVADNGNCGGCNGNCGRGEPFLGRDFASVAPSAQ